GAVFRVDDVDAYYRSMQAQRLNLEPPKDAPWGERFLHVTDPDGHELSFAEPLPARILAHRTRTWSGLSDALAISTSCFRGPLGSGGQADSSAHHDGCARRATRGHVFEGERRGGENGGAPWTLKRKSCPLKSLSSIELLPAVTSSAAQAS